MINVNNQVFPEAHPPFPSSSPHPFMNMDGASLLCLMVTLWKMMPAVSLAHNPPGACTKLISIQRRHEDDPIRTEGQNQQQREPRFSARTDRDEETFVLKLRVSRPATSRGGVRRWRLFEHLKGVTSQPNVCRTGKYPTQSPAMQHLWFKQKQMQQNKDHRSLSNFSHLEKVKWMWK